MLSKINKENYYVYMYLNFDNIPFYVGKGKNDRHKVLLHLTSANLFLTRKINKIGKENVKIHFLHKDISEAEAFDWERYWIKYIGRRDLKEGSLCNLTDGGEGRSGRLQPLEVNRKRSKTLKGRVSPFKGCNHSVETKQKIKEGLKRNPRLITDEVLQKQSEGLKRAWALRGGHSEETKRKISVSRKGKTVGVGHPQYGKPSPRKGQKVSEETIQKMCVAQQSRRTREKNIID